MRHDLAVLLPAAAAAPAAAAVLEGPTEVAAAAVAMLWRPITPAGAVVAAAAVVAAGPMPKSPVAGEARVGLCWHVAIRTSNRQLAGGVSGGFPAAAAVGWASAAAAV